MSCRRLMWAISCLSRVGEPGVRTSPAKKALHTRPYRPLGPPRRALPSRRRAARTTASPILRMGTFYEASAVKLQFRVIGHERQRSDMLLAACLDIRPGRKASDDLLSVPTTRVGPHPVFALRRISANS